MSAIEIEVEGITPQLPPAQLASNDLATAERGAEEDDQRAGRQGATKIRDMAVDSRSGRVQITKKSYRIGPSLRIPPRSQALKKV
mmetsp:Transcript_7044/g.21480  ORF Transcript_7044/g.21480 Transcript_7044/m.21480 type:complete len:85 (-) Transcript_7044:643-897(-)